MGIVSRRVPSVVLDKGAAFRDGGSVPRRTSRVYCFCVGVRGRQQQHAYNEWRRREEGTSHEHKIRGSSKGSVPQ